MRVCIRHFGSHDEVYGVVRGIFVPIAKRKSGKMGIADEVFINGWSAYYFGVEVLIGE